LSIEGKEGIVKVLSPLIFGFGDIEVPKRESEAAKAVGRSVAEVCLVDVAEPYSVVGDRGGEGAICVEGA
jgi:hypothetical protein